MISAQVDTGTGDENPKEEIMEAVKQFLKRKDIEISLKRYGIDALGAMAQGLF